MGGLPDISQSGVDEAVTAARQKSGPHNAGTKSRLDLLLPSRVVPLGAEEGTPIPNVQTEQNK